MVLLNLPQIIISVHIPMWVPWETSSEKVHWGGPSAPRAGEEEGGLRTGQREEQLHCRHTKASGDPTGSSGARRAPRHNLELITFPLRQVISLKLTEEVPEVTLGKAAHPSLEQCLGRDSAESAQCSLWECFTPQGGRCGPCTKAFLAVQQNLQASPAKWPVAICRAFTLGGCQDHCLSSLLPLPQTSDKDKGHILSITYRVMFEILSIQYGNLAMAVVPEV